MPSGSPGRPKVYVNVKFVELLKEAGYTWTEIGAILGTSKSTLWRHLKDSGVLISPYCDVSDSALDYIVRRYQE